MTIELNRLPFVLDESAGLQDDDIAVEDVPAGFTDFLGAEADNGLGFAASADNLIVVSDGADPASVTFNLSTDGVDSGLTTTAGDPVLLFLEDGGRIVTGRVGDSAGDIVLALYLADPMETAPGSGEFNVQVFSYLDDAIQHPETDNNDEDIFILGNILSVEASTSLEFPFDDAPSGQNYFLAFGSKEAFIIVTSSDPDNSTTNSSKGGGDVTLAVDNNNIDPGEGMFITFAQDDDSNLIVPDLTSTQASNEANIDFTNLLDGGGGEFSVVKFTGGETTTTVKITAFDSNVQSGTEYSETLSDREAIGITEILVNGENVTLVPDGDGYLISGVPENAVITYKTAESTNQVLIEHGGSGANFAIGSFTILDSLLEEVALDGIVGFGDDGPVAELAAVGDGLTVDESVGADAADPNANDEAGETATLILGETLLGVDEGDMADLGANASLGTDGAGSMVFSLGLNGGAASINSGLETTDGTDVILQIENGVLVGRTDDASQDPVFAFSINASTGVGRLEQYAALKHPTNPNPDENLAFLADKAEIVLTATDADGDSETASLDLAGRLNFHDDGPKVTIAQKDADIDLSDANLNVTQTASLASLFSGTHDAGSDGTGSGPDFSLTLDVASGASSGLTDVATGQDVLLYAEDIDGDGDTDIVARTATSNEEVLRVTIDATTGISATQSRAVFHEQPANDTSITLAANLFSVSKSLSDGDGDSVSASASLSDLINIADDVPVINGVTLNPADQDNPSVANDMITGEVDLDEGNDGATVNIVDATGIEFNLAEGGSPAASGHSYTYFDVDGDNEIGSNEVKGYLDGEELYTMIVFDDDTFEFTLLDPLEGTAIELDTGNIKAGGPDSTSINVGIVGSPVDENGDAVDFVRISGEQEVDGSQDDEPAPVNESNNNVGVNNGNLDAGEELCFEVFQDGEFIDISGISVGTKTAQGFNYEYQLFNAEYNEMGEVVSKVQVGTTGGGNVTKNGEIMISSESLFNMVCIKNLDGNAVKIGLEDIQIFIPADPETVAFDFEAVDRDGDKSLFLVEDFDNDPNDTPAQASLDSIGITIDPLDAPIA